MVHPKKKSGDPDYDDKVPAEQHAGGTLVKTDDGREVFISDVIGPVDAAGAHVALDGPTAEDLDNRPEPGGQATEASAVQTYNPEDVAPGKVDAIPLEQFRKEQAGQQEEAAPAAADAKTEAPAQATPTAGKRASTK